MNPADESPLTFHWPERREISLALPVFFVLSLLAHAATFYLFQIVYPPSATSATPPAEASFWTASTGGSAFQLWLNSEDPALMTKPAEAAPPNNFDVAYQPFFSTVRAEPQQVGASGGAIPFPRGWTASALLRPQVQEEAAAPAAKPLFTRLEFSDSIRGLKPSKLPKIPIQTPSATILQPTKFFVGISGKGVVSYAFVEASSGNAAIDETAEAWLSALHCNPSQGGVKWGFATFLWGVDAMKAVSKE